MKGNLKLNGILAISQTLSRSRNLLSKLMGSYVFSYSGALSSISVGDLFVCAEYKLGKPFRQIDVVIVVEFCNKVYFFVWLGFVRLMRSH